MYAGPSGEECDNSDAEYPSQTDKEKSDKQTFMIFFGLDAPRSALLVPAACGWAVLIHFPPAA
jgi:hypothetical protein